MGKVAGAPVKARTGQSCTGNFSFQLCFVESYVNGSYSFDPTKSTLQTYTLGLAGPSVMIIERHRPTANTSPGLISACRPTW